VRADALSALLNLGYQRSAAEKAIGAAMAESEEMTVETVLRASLRRLAKG
jgi:Holliday junction resolvasome RuvABC DNA-binding subunit